MERNRGYDFSRPSRTEVRSEQADLVQNNLAASKSRRQEVLARQEAEDEADWITGLNDGGHENQDVDETDPEYQNWIADHNSKPREDKMGPENGSMEEIAKNAVIDKNKFKTADEVDDPNRLMQAEYKMTPDGLMVPVVEMNQDELNNAGLQKELAEQNNLMEKVIADAQPENAQPTPTPETPVSKPDQLEVVSQESGQPSLLKKEQIGENPDGSPIYNQGFDIKVAGRFAQEQNENDKQAKSEDESKDTTSGPAIQPIIREQDSANIVESDQSEGQPIPPNPADAEAQSNQQESAESSQAEVDPKPQSLEAQLQQQRQWYLGELKKLNENVIFAIRDGKIISSEPFENLNHPAGFVSDGAGNMHNTPMSEAYPEVPNEIIPMEHDPNLTKEEADRLNQENPEVKNNEDRASENSEASPEGQAKIEDLQKQVDELKKKIEENETDKDTLKKQLDELMKKAEPDPSSTEPSPGFFSKLGGVWKKIVQLIYGLGNWLGSDFNSEEKLVAAQEAQSKINEADQQVEESAKQIAAERMARLDAIRKPYQDKFDYYRNNADVSQHLEKYDFEVIGKTMNGMTEAMFQAGDTAEKNARLSKTIVQQQELLAFEENPEQAKILEKKIEDWKKTQADNEQEQKKWESIVEQELGHWNELMKNLDELANKHSENAGKLKNLARKIGLAVPRDQFYFTADGKMGDKIEDIIEQEAKVGLVNNQAVSAPESQPSIADRSQVTEIPIDQLEEPENINVGVPAQVAVEQPSAIPLTPAA